MKLRIEKHAALLAGRVLAVLVLFVAGLLKFAKPAMTGDEMRYLGIPGAGETLALLAGAVEVGGALAVFAGWRTRTVALLLAVYLVPITWYTHLDPLWGALAAGDVPRRMHELFECLKNFTLIGALLLLAAVGPGAHSLDKK